MERRFRGMLDKTAYRQPQRKEAVTTMLKLRIGQLHQDITMQPGESIAQALLRKDYKVPMACGGNGTCGKCKVEIDGAWVNSCKIYPEPEEDITISAFGWGESREELTQIAGVEKINITEGRAREAKRQTRKAFLAVDIGTTTIAAALADKETGAVLATAGCSNSQRIFGQDVLSRIKESV